jgi:hypothetical protein
MLLNINDPDTLKMIVELESVILTCGCLAVAGIFGWFWKIYRAINQKLNEMLAIKRYEEDKRQHEQEHAMLQNKLETKFEDLHKQIGDYRLETMKSISDEVSKVTMLISEVNKSIGFLSGKIDNMRKD